MPTVVRNCALISGTARLTIFSSKALAIHIQVECHCISRCEKLAIHNVLPVDEDVAIMFLSQRVANIAIDLQPSIVILHSNHLPLTTAEKGTPRRRIKLH